jgi:hypothetical protein
MNLEWMNVLQSFWEEIIALVEEKAKELHQRSRWKHTCCVSLYRAGCPFARVSYNRTWWPQLIAVLMLQHIHSEVELERVRLEAL